MCRPYRTMNRTIVKLLHILHACLPYRTTNIYHIHTCETKITAYLLARPPQSSKGKRVLEKFLCGSEGRRRREMRPTHD